MFPILAPTPPAVARLLSTKSPVHIIIGLGSALWQDSWLSLRWIIALFSCLWIVYSIAFHYYMAVKEAPGSVIDGLSDELRERRVGLGSDVWWSRHYDRVCKESITAARSQSQFSLLTNSVARKIEEITDEELIRVKEGEDLWVNVKVCHKCPRIPLWKAIACLPPELRRVEREIRSRKENDNRSQVESRNGSIGNGNGRRSTSPGDMDEWARGETVEEIQAWLGDETNKLVPVPKPERTHHCSVCDVCILKFDHHCPWLNQCVGIGNERYFVLFMVWLAIGCLVVVASGWRVVADSVSIYKPWRNAYTPRIFPLLTYALCALMGFGLSIMAVWQLLIVGWGETSVESSDNTHYREVCRRKGTKFSNVYDIGFVHNLLLFFNVSPLSNRSLWTILAPWRIEPYSDGWHFSKKLGGQGRHAGLAPEEELSDDEVERDDAHPMAN